MSTFLTAYFWLFLGFEVAAIASVTIRSPGSGRSKDFSQVSFWIARLLRSGYDNGHLRIVHDQSGRCLYFRKYIHGKGDCGLELCCPLSGWSEEERRKVAILADDRGLPHRKDTRNLEGGDARDVLVVDCGQDVTGAYELAKATWAEVFGLSLKTCHRTEEDGLADLGELVDGPDHPPPLRHELRTHDWQHVDARMRRAGVPPTSTALYAGLLALLAMISGIAFPLAMLLSRGAAPDWSVQLGPMALGGDTTSLVLFVILGLSFWGTIRIDWGKATIRARPRDTWERREFVIGRIFAVTLPIAVILAWAGF